MPEKSTKSSGSVAMLSRKESKLSESLERRLKAYVLAAGAVGAVLAAPSVANADIITASGFSYPLGGGGGGSFSSRGVTVDGITEFRFLGFHYQDTFIGGSFFGSSGGAAAWLYASGSGGGALTGLLGKGVKVGPKLNFGTSVYLGQAHHLRRISYYCNPSGCSTIYKGTSHSARALGSGYLGLRFLVDGQPHYGWARINAHASAGSDFDAVWGTLGPIAYDTVVAQPILTGQTMPTPEPATLSLLALGVAASGDLATQETEGGVGFACSCRAGLDPAATDAPGGIAATALCS